MSDASANPDRISGYHAHIYYAPETRPTAAGLRAAIGERFQARIGGWHDEPVGPHPVSMYQVAFAGEEFAGALADAQPRRAECPSPPVNRRQRRRPHAICGLAGYTSVVAARCVAPGASMIGGTTSSRAASTSDVWAHNRHGQSLIAGSSRPRRI